MKRAKQRRVAQLMAPHRAAQVRAARRDLDHRRRAAAREATRLATAGDEDLMSSVP